MACARLRVSRRLNVPYMLGLFPLVALSICSILIESVNAPFGARCFLRDRQPAPAPSRSSGLNALYGARYLLTRAGDVQDRRRQGVLMHLMALGAF